MIWTRLGPYSETSDTGHTVSAARTQAGWRFTAWGPSAAPSWDYRAFANGKTPHWAGTRYKVSYAVGEHVPQLYPMLGTCETAAEARALCAADAARSTNHDTMGVQQCLTTRR
jgi:hypothetical protein